MIPLLYCDIIYSDNTPQITPHYSKGCVKMVLTSSVKKSSINHYILECPKPVIREKKKVYMRHDQLFKELIHNFFEEFIQAFFPEVHEHIDFQSIQPMSEEVFTDLLDGESRRADIVIEAKLKGEDTLLIIHVEPQSSHQTYFHERMYHYYSLLYNKYRKPILPIAVFSYDEKRTAKNQFTIEFPFYQVLVFNFLKLELGHMNWRKYLQSDNPVAAALLSKMGYTDEEKVQVKREFLRMIVKMELTPAKMRIILGFFEKYLILDEEEEETLMEEIKQMDESESIMHLPISWEEKGKQEGRKEGEKEARRAIALEMLKEGASIDFIIKVTKLDRTEIEEFKKEHKY